MTWKRGTFGGRTARRAGAAPLARTDELVVEDLAGEGGQDEVLVYDRRTDQAHCLTREAAMVWRVCDGRTQPSELAAALGFELELVTRALEELSECDLLDVGAIEGITRREATLKLARVGGVAAAAPLIYSILAPTPALASSQNFCLKLTGCTSDSGATGCGFCHSNGCACCGVASNGIPGLKLCTADCSTDPVTGNCTTAVAEAHCQGTNLSTTTCN